MNNNNIEFDGKIECALALNAIKEMPEEGKRAFIGMLEAYRIGFEQGRSILRAELETAKAGGEV